MRKLSETADPVWETVLSQGGPWAIVVGQWTLMGLSVVRGWLVPRSIHRERVADLQAAIVDKNATIAAQQAQLAVLLGARAREPTV